MKPVSFSPIARRQIKAALEWWAENIDNNILVTEIEDAVELIRQFPGAGKIPRESTRLPAVRQIFLSESSYHLYYRELGEKLVILRLWHTSRGATPKL